MRLRLSNSVRRRASTAIFIAHIGCVQRGWMRFVVGSALWEVSSAPDRSSG